MKLFLEFLRDMFEWLAPPFLIALAVILAGFYIISFSDSFEVSDFTQIQMLRTLEELDMFEASFACDDRRNCTVNYYGNLKAFRCYEKMNTFCVLNE